MQVGADLVEDSFVQLARFQKGLVGDDPQAVVLAGQGDGVFQALPQ